MAISVYAKKGDTLWKHEYGRTELVGIVTKVRKNFRGVVDRAVVGGREYRLFEEDVVVQPPESEVSEAVSEAIGNLEGQLIPARDDRTRLMLFKLDVGVVEISVVSYDACDLRFDTSKGNWYEGKPVQCDSETSAWVGSEKIELGINLYDEEVVERYF